MEAKKNREKQRFNETLELIGGKGQYELVPPSLKLAVVPSISDADMLNYLVFYPLLYKAEDLKYYEGLPKGYRGHGNGETSHWSALVNSILTVHHTYILPIDII